MADAQKVHETAVSLFHAFVSGVASRDVSQRRMTTEAAERWTREAVNGFAATLKEMTKEGRTNG